MSLKDLVVTNRSCRRFVEREPVSRETLMELVDLARICPSGANLQPLKYFLSADRETNQKIFPSLKWAGLLRDWGGPAEGEKPAAYILVLLDTEVSAKTDCDHGIAAQTILLGAVEAGLAGCMLGAIDRQALRSALKIPTRFEIALVIALGRPGETRIIVPLGENGSTGYYRNAQDVHCVPKRSLQDVVVEF